MSTGIGGTYPSLLGPPVPDFPPIKAFRVRGLEKVERHGLLLGTNKSLRDFRNGHENKFRRHFFRGDEEKYLSL